MGMFEPERERVRGCTYSCAGAEVCNEHRPHSVQLILQVCVQQPFHLLIRRFSRSAKFLMLLYSIICTYLFKYYCFSFLLMFNCFVCGNIKG